MSQPPGLPPRPNPMQPGAAPPGMMAPGQPPSMAPGQPPGQTMLPIPPLNMAPGMAPGVAGMPGVPLQGPPRPHMVPGAAMAPGALTPGMAPGSVLPPGMPGVPPQPATYAAAYAQQLAAQQHKRPADAADTSPAAKRMRPGEPEDPAAAAAAMRPAAAAPHGIGLPSPVALGMPPVPAPAPGPGAHHLLAALQQITAKHAAVQVAASQELKRQAAMNAEDEGKVLPRRGIRLALKAAGMDKDFVVDPATEAALLEFYNEWITSAVAMGCDAAKRRNSTVLRARDISLHLERAWNIYVPGFAADTMRPYRRATASELHKLRHSAVRKTAAELDHQAQQAAHRAGNAGGGGAAAGGGG